VSAFYLAGSPENSTGSKSTNKREVLEEAGAEISLSGADAGAEGSSRTEALRNDCIRCS
jgi:hypothetical protein